MAKLYTRTGDDGTTGFAGGRRVSKSALRVCAYGEVDELNAVLGWTSCEAKVPLRDQVREVQRALFAMGAELASANESNPAGSNFVQLNEKDVQQLERWIDQACESVPALKHFVLPGGTEVGARLHVARAVCRRAERAVVALMQAEAVRPVVLQYLNRLGDLLFAWARYVNHTAGQEEVVWEGDRVNP